MNVLGHPTRRWPGVLELPGRGVPSNLLTKRSREGALVVFALVAATVAFWVTLDAGFLAHPAWLAVQKVDFILGPIGVGLYWLHRRPGNRLGLILILLGLSGVIYIGSSINAPLPFGIGVFWEIPIVLLTEAAILAFPAGRLERPERVILIFWTLTFFVGRITIWLTSPHSSPWFSISACRHGACPANPGALWSTPSWSPDLVKGVRAAVIVGALATIGLLVWKFLTGTPPRRRALAIGAPIALIYLVLQTTYQALQLFRPANSSAAAPPVTGAIDWAFAGARSAVWYGFLFALIAAQLFAGRVLRDVVRRSRGRPAATELEAMLREPLGDPGLRIGSWNPRLGRFATADGGAFAPPVAGQTRTEIERQGEPAVALVHDAQLSEDPELLHAAGEVTMMALENAELDASWRESLAENSQLVEELRASRARIVSAGREERLQLERNLHDGAQQRLMAIQIKLRMARERMRDEGLAEELREIGTDAADAVEELRALAHGLYPSTLRDGGLVDAFNALAMRAPIAMRVDDRGVGRCSAETEAAVYFCACEAVQNAIKHAGDGASVTITLQRYPGAVQFAVTDDGIGMDLRGVHEGAGLVGMRDRIGAVGGELEVGSAPGRGTRVRGTVPS